MIMIKWLLKFLFGDFDMEAPDLEGDITIFDPNLYDQ